MSELGTIVDKIRSKNAGPFWVTIDIFCGSIAAYEWTVKHLSTQMVADLFRQPVGQIKRFDIADLQVVKFSLPRPEIQGTRADRDMHGAGWGPLLADLKIDAAPPAP